MKIWSAVIHRRFAYAAERLWNVARRDHVSSLRCRFVHALVTIVGRERTTTRCRWSNQLRHSAMNEHA